MSDFSITLKKAQKKKIKCRYFWLKDCKNSENGKYGGYLKEGTPYISMNGWGSGGRVTLCVCKAHFDDFFNQINTIINELNNPDKE